MDEVLLQKVARAIMEAAKRERLGDRADPDLPLSEGDLLRGRAALDAIKEADRIIVSKDALFRLLVAINSTGPELREMQATRDLPGGLMVRNPIDVLLAQYIVQQG